MGPVAPPCRNVPPARGGSMIFSDRSNASVAWSPTAVSHKKADSSLCSIFFISYRRIPGSIPSTSNFCCKVISC